MNSLILKISPMKRFLWVALFILIMLLVASGCGANSSTGGTVENSKNLGGNQSNDGSQDDFEPLKVTTTTGMIADVVRNVGGEYVEVSALMGEGVDPHVFKATQGDLRKLSEAEMIFYNGLHLEAKLTEVLEAMNKDKPTVAVAEFIDESKLLAGDIESGGQYDPHVWFDVELWMDVTEVIRDELVQAVPTHKDQIEANADEYLTKLEELHQYVQEQIASIPVERRVLVTAHDAFGYFGAAYDIEVRGLQGISTASEAGVKDVTDLVNYLVERKIKAVFVETSVSDKSIHSVIEGVEAKGHSIKEGGSLYSDAMGAEGTEEGTYIGMVKHNVDTIVAALK